MLGVDPAEDLDRVFPLTDDDRAWDRYYGEFCKMLPAWTLMSTVLCTNMFIKATAEMTKEERATEWEVRYWASIPEVT